ncbi:DUF58 domain-containing protein [Gemmobacter serpentinus]|uniref:DUF58 domain-containing protein n=1 Tax=Gemmobacter serpentinus TaxID=2652247 RepID=UPI00124E5AA0|nr:DUF58 domain-containing protein [Gemmobacter serpentinus]
MSNAPDLAADLRARAGTLGAALPPLLAAADHLASAVTLGDHGRRRAGMGDEFWQYRQAHTGDAARMIDWRRSARGDVQYVREREWQAAQSVSLWVDTSASMRFSGDKMRAPKADRARLLALALSVLLLRGGERVGLTGGLTPPRSGRAQAERLALALSEDGTADFGKPDATGILPHGRVVLISDFLGDLSGVEAAMGAASDRGARGVILQVLDPAEETFPFDGRTIFESMGGSLRFETLRAGDLRARYLARLEERRARLSDLARASGWHLSSHHTGDAAQPALLWLYRALEAAL